MNTNNQRIIFDLPEETALSDVIGEILKSNGLEESDEEFFDKDIKGQEPRALIIRDAALALFEKKVSEKKLAELLHKHLKTSAQIAQKIIADIRQKLIPAARVIGLDDGGERMGIKKEPIDEQGTEEARKEAFQKAKEELLNKIRASAPKSEPEPAETQPDVRTKNVPITNVEENAKNMEREGQNVTTEKKLPPPNQQKTAEEKKITDPYKEPIE